VTSPRGHDHDHDHEGGGECVAAGPRVSGRSRQNKLVHLDGGPDLVGRLVAARIEHAGPYALRGVLTGE
jgi:hypothetical protein